MVGNEKKLVSVPPLTNEEILWIREKREEEAKARDYLLEVLIRGMKGTLNPEDLSSRTLSSEKVDSKPLLLKSGTDRPSSQSD